MFDPGSPPPSVPAPTDTESALGGLLLSALAGSARAENQHADRHHPGLLAHLTLPAGGLTSVPAADLHAAGP